MALSDANKAALAFKNTQGKAHTATNKELGNEEEEFRFIVGSDTVWLSQLTDTPDPALVEQIQATLLPDPTSNGRAFFTYYPAGHPKAGQRVLNTVPHSFSNVYEAVIRAADGTRITEFDSRDWVYQYQPGIFFQQTANASPVPATATVYIYKGQTLQSLLESGSGSLGGGAAQWFDTGDSFATTGSVEIQGPEVRFEGSNIVWENELVNNYSIDPSTTRELNLIAHYGMTGSVSIHGTMFTLNVPVTGTMVDAEFIILAKNTTLTEHSRFKFSLYAFNQGNGTLFVNDLVQTIPNITTSGWDFNIRTLNDQLLVDVTGSAPHLIDWTLHGKFAVG
jgi:hypothetical protein